MFIRKSFVHSFYRNLTSIELYLSTVSNSQRSVSNRKLVICIHRVREIVSRMTRLLASQMNYTQEKNLNRSPGLISLGADFCFFLTLKLWYDLLVKPCQRTIQISNWNLLLRKAWIRNRKLRKSRIKGCSGCYCVKGRDRRSAVRVASIFNFIFV